MKIYYTGDVYFDQAIPLWNNKLDKDHQNKEFSKQDLFAISDYLIDEYSFWGESDKNRFVCYFFNWHLLGFSVFSTKLDQKKKKEIFIKLKEKFNLYINSIEKVNNKPCVICGQNEGNIYISRNEYIAAGSFGKRNGYSGLDEGIPICGICSLRLHSYPINTVTDKTKTKAIICNSLKPELQKIWLTITQKNKTLSTEPVTILSINKLNVIYELVVGSSCLQYTFLSEMLRNSIKIESSLKFIYFSNFGSKPEYEQFDFSNKVFNFYLKLEYNNQLLKWKHFVNRFYSGNLENGKYQIIYDDKKNKILFKSKKEEREAQPEEYIMVTNYLVYKLLNNIPLTIKDFSKNRMLLVDIDIIYGYLREVLMIEQFYIEKAKKLASILKEKVLSGDKKINSIMNDLDTAEESPQKFDSFISFEAKEHAKKGEGKFPMNPDDFSSDKNFYFKNFILCLKLSFYDEMQEQIKQYYSKED